MRYTHAMSTNSFQMNKRAIGLDILRIILCIMVLICHYGNIGCIRGWIGYPGMAAVTGFFVLAGYLLGQAFNRTATFNSSAFYRNKAEKLLPTCAICMTFAILLHLAYACVIPDWQLTRSSAQNWENYFNFYNGPSWFIWKYFIYMAIAPLLYELYQSKRLFSICLIALAAYSLFAYGYKHNPFIYATEFHLLAFMTGILAAAWHPLTALTAGIRKILTYVSILIPLILLLVDTCSTKLFFSISGLSFIENFLLIGVFALAIPLWGSFLSEGKSSPRKWLIYASALTYPIFLLHRPFMDLCLHLSGLWHRVDNVAGHFLAIGVSFLLTLAASIALESFLRRRTRGAKKVTSPARGGN